MSGGIGNNDEDTVVSTEDEILNNVQDISGDDFENDDSDEIDQEEDEDAEDPDAQTTEEVAKPDEQSARQRVDRTEVAKRIPAQRRVDYDYDPKTGDVINPKDGKVIFKNGTIEREMFTQLRDTQYKASQAEGKMREYVNYGQKIEKELQAYKQAPSVGDTLKLNTEDQVRAFQMMAAYKADPVKAFRKMLNDYQVDGGDLTDIFDNLEKIQLEGLEARLGQHVDKLVKPQLDEQARTSQQQEMVNRLNSEIQVFFQNNADAEPHADLLAHVIQRAAENGRGLSLNDAWTQVLRFANARRLDLNSDLRAQLEEVQPQQRVQQQRTAMPSGRNGRTMRAKDSRPSHERTSKDLVAEAMREAGFEI